MENKVKIVGLGGSLKADSTSLMALRFALDAAEESGAEVEMFDVRELNLPMYTPGMEAPAAATRLARTACAAQGMIWSSPLYHGTVSGSFKNAIDWLDLLRGEDPLFLSDKIIGLVSTAGGTQGLQAINTMEYIVRALRAWAVPFVLPVGQAWQAFDAHGHPSDPRTAEQLQTLGSEVVRAAQQMGATGSCDYSEPTMFKAR